ncbi:MAG: hypothetical protein OES26_26665, partial [Gammaproteobacteria bacterium]|nr:hypothetical protein [Gammaproteobacteria bacterium]
AVGIYRRFGLGRAIWRTGASSHRYVEPNVDYPVPSMRMPNVRCCLPYGRDCAKESPHESGRIKLGFKVIKIKARNAGTAENS